MQTSVIAILSFVALAVARPQQPAQPARHISITKATDDPEVPIRSFIVDVPVVGGGFTDYTFLRNVTELEEVRAEVSATCVAIGTDGNIVGKPFGLLNPLHLSDTGVDLKAITCTV